MALARDEKDDRLLPHTIRRQSRLTVKKATKRKVSDKRSQIVCRHKNCSNPSCLFWHPPVCQNYKSEKRCVYGDKCHFRHVEAEGTQQKIKERWYKRISCDIGGVYTIGLCISRFFSKKVYSAWTLKIGFKNTTSNSPKVAGTQLKFGRERVHREASLKSVNLTSAIRAPTSLRRGHKTKPPRKVRPQSGMGLGEECLWTQNIDGASFYSPMEARATTAPISKSPEVRESGCWLRSINAHAEQKGSELRGNGGSQEIQEPHNGGDGQCGSANKRGTTSFRSRSWSLRDGANTQWHACSSITWKALRRPRILPWVDQRPKATPDQTREEDSLQDGKFRTSCCPWIVVKFWYQFVLYIATTGLIKYIFRSSHKFLKERVRREELSNSVRATWT